MGPRTAHGPTGGNPATGGCQNHPKMPKSPSEGVGIDRRRPSYSGGKPRVAKHTRHARPREVYLGVGWIPPLLKAPSNDTRPLADRYKDCPDIHRMDIRTPHSPPWGPGWRGPPDHRILQQEIRWRAPKCDYRVSAALVQIGGAPAAQVAYPDSRRTFGSRTDRLPHMGFCWAGRGGREAACVRLVPPLGGITREPGSPW